MPTSTMEILKLNLDHDPTLTARVFKVLDNMGRRETERLDGTDRRITSRLDGTELKKETKDE